MQSNYVAITNYLKEYNIDATQIPIDSISENGYDLYSQTHDGRPVYKTGERTAFVRERTFHEWPSELVYLNVCLFMTGATEADMLTEVPKPPELAVPTPKAAPKPPVKK